MISEGSCDTEDWRNDAENSALITGINYILKYIKIENLFKIIILNCNNISQNYSFLYSRSNKCSLDEHTKLLKKH